MVVKSHDVTVSNMLHESTVRAGKKPLPRYFLLYCVFVVVLCLLPQKSKLILLLFVNSKSVVDAKNKPPCLFIFEKQERLIPAARGEINLCILLDM